MPETFAHLEETKNALTRQVLWQREWIETLRGTLEWLLENDELTQYGRKTAQDALDNTKD